ncbi:MAG: hypothetical protein BTN85_1672 [Candidatus Methanohalarchaeum thermophilum]|uniref:Uncharacterized protein n=1 Tax=Methanohalarchaeum thermophilum TaxID=1903181 RepID=A0A1Q6DXS1_METT1|nr:MAG: hypothetical protein BTN85_1672 [Candidatus Methanohalarchaeum thermophilum]
MLEEKFEGVRKEQRKLFGKEGDAIIGRSKRGGWREPIRN